MGHDVIKRHHQSEPAHSAGEWGAPHQAAWSPGNDASELHNKRVTEGELAVNGWAQ